METSCRIYDDVINILDQLYFLHLSVFIAYPLIYFKSPVRSISNFFLNVPHAFGLFLIYQSIVQHQAVTISHMAR